MCLLDFYVIVESGNYALLPALEGATAPGRTTQGRDNSEGSQRGSSSGAGGMRQAAWGMGLVEPEKGQESHQVMHLL